MINKNRETQINVKYFKLIQQTKALTFGSAFPSAASLSSTFDL